MKSVRTFYIDRLRPDEIFLFTVTTHVYVELLRQKHSHRILNLLTDTALRLRNKMAAHAAGRDVITKGVNLIF